MKRLFQPFLAAALLAAAPHVYGAGCEGIVSGLDAIGTKPQNTAPIEVGKELDEIIDQGFIEIGVYESFPPFSYTEQGKLVGIDVDLAQHIAAELGVEARVRAIPAGENVDADLRNYVWKGPLIGGKVVNVLLHMPYNKELGCRNEQVVLSGQYFNEQLVIAHRKDRFDGDPPKPAWFRFEPVGVENDSIADFYLAGFAGGQLLSNLKHYKTNSAAMDALKAGEISAVMGPRTELEPLMDENIGIHRPDYPGLQVSEWTLGVAVRHTFRPLGYTVDDIIRNAVNDGTVEAIFAKYGASYTPPNW